LSITLITILTHFKILTGLLVKILAMNVDSLYYVGKLRAPSHMRDVKLAKSGAWDNVHSLTFLHKNI